MSRDALKLTTYFGESDRGVADALLALYARHEVEASLLLRGAAGFGAKHHLRTDTLLTLSEDLPLVSVAVDTRERIAALVDEVGALHRTGLVTVERAKLITGPPMVHEFAKVTLYVTGRPAYVEACAVLHRHGVTGATVLRGVDGTVHGGRRRGLKAPAAVVAVGSGQALTAALQELRPRLATLERVRIAEPQRADGMWTKLTVHAPAGHEQELIRRLRAGGVRGATTLHGVWGFHGDGPSGERLLQIRRRVPVVTVIVDTPDRIDRAFSITAGAGLVTSELVPGIGPELPG